ncbi:MAG: hypothetical protein UY15_C0020G0019 [Parcubacteria group bacterium GW2011_GWA2_47_9]|nr:MAG: hypothetical protein UY15_C0020G0019 [Parcubacteria group bacterium GW2011_GWA2_47_9]
MIGFVQRFFPIRAKSDEKMYEKLHRDAEKYGVSI